MLLIPTTHSKYDAILTPVVTCTANNIPVKTISNYHFTLSNLIKHLYSTKIT